MTLAHGSVCSVHQAVLVVVVLLCCFSTAVGDLCQDISDDFDLLDYVHAGATPQGGQLAGTYTRGLVDGKNASSLAECLLSCCDSPSCNVIFFHRARCYLIACNVSNPGACDPVEHDDDPKFKNTYLISVRSQDETAYLHTSPPSAGIISDTDSSPAVEECILDSADTCGLNEECNLLVKHGEIHYICDCIRGYARNDITLECTVRRADVSCEFGVLDECLPYEECRVQNGRSRSGICVCVEGYTPDPDTRLCTEEQLSDKAEQISKVSATTKSTAAASIQNTTTTSTTTPTTKTSPTTKTTPTTAPVLQSSTTNQPDPGLNGQQSTTTPAPPLAPLVVSAGDDREITLPNNEVTLNAFVIPEDENGGYQYQWSLVAHPSDDETGKMVGINTDSLQLSQLTAGLYTFKVVVTADGKYGEASVNVTVNPAVHINTPPIAVIKPPNQTVKQPNDVVLDGAESTDDVKVVQYHWEQVSGPLESPGIADQDVDNSMLVLHGLNPGEYKFKLTVTDTDGAPNFTFANVTVIKETDYPPTANAGSNVILNLPQNSVTLYGNSSTDDKGIVSYEWIKNADDKLTADMKGVRTPVLELENLEEGAYTFTLKVTDTAGQVATADVHVFVKAEQNKPPAAHAGLNKTLWLPQNLITLDASNSTDDKAVVSYKWTQVSGPSSVTIENTDRAIATAPNLVAGVYKFKVVVSDLEGQQSSDTVYITVKQDDNKAPVANAGGNTVVYLPAPLVNLDGTKSMDDRGIVSWLWTRDDSSLATGAIVNGSEHRAVLQLTSLVAGRYVFILTVSDAEGLTNSDTATLTVNPEKNKDDLVELRLDTNVRSFTEADKKNLASQIALLLHKDIQNTDVHIQELTEDRGSGRLLVLFYVSQDAGGAAVEVVPGRVVASALRERLWSDSSLLDFNVLTVDTLVCQNNCSGHGKCDQSTKRCICEAFWMQNPFKLYIDEQTNCQWSILYVIIIAFISLVMFIGVTWGLVFLCRRWYWTRPKKRHRYTLLDDLDDADDRNGIELSQKDKGLRRNRQKRSLNNQHSKIGKVQSSSLMVSESDFSSDEETLFINRKSNGHAGKNGIVRPNKSKVKA